MHGHLAPLWDIWHILHGSRDVGMSGAAALRLSEIQAALELYEVPPAGRWPWVRLLLALDAEYLKLSMMLGKGEKPDGGPRAVAAGEPPERGRRAGEALA